MRARSQNARAARWYGEHGIAVFPVCPRSKVPFRGSQGDVDGTTDLATIERWWTDRPEASIGAALRYTPYFVVDVDARAFGDEWLAALELEHGRLPDTVTAISGSGYPGMHYWFRRPLELDDAVCSKLGPGIDIKGLRYGFVILPPSKHPSGKQYAWEASSRIDEVEIAEPPAWLVRELQSKAKRRVEGYQHAGAVDPDSFLLGRLFKKAGLLIGQVRHGVFAVHCPNEAKHSQKSSSSASVLFAPKHPGDRGTFFCAHTSACSEVFR